MVAGDRLLWLSQWRALRYSIVATVLFLMALPLEARAIGRALRNPAPSLLGSSLNLGVLPLLAWPVALFAQPWLGRDTAYGILVAATSPCTLASASVWTRRAGGNDAVAMMVTVATNLLCFIVTPLWLVAMTGSHADLALGPLVTKLGLLVVSPMLLAQCVRLHPVIGRQSLRHKPTLSTLAQFGILSMVFLGAIQTGHRLTSLEKLPMWWQWAALVGIVGGIHVVVLYGGRFLSKTLRMEAADQKAVAVAGSQKTLMVGLQVAMELQWSIIPMVVYHVSQLVIDTWITDRWRDESSGGRSAPDT